MKILVINESPKCDKPIRKDTDVYAVTEGVWGSINHVSDQAE